MAAEDGFSPELEALRGATTLEVARFVIGNLPQVSYVALRPYVYVPNTPSGDEQQIPVSREDFLHGSTVEDIIAGTPEDYNVALDSRLWLEGQEPGEEPAAHLPMMDLSVPKSPYAVDFVRERFGIEILPEFGGGFLIETNKSYHFLGRQLFPASRYLNFTSRMLRAAQETQVHKGVERIHTHIADYRYISYSLERGSTGLRLTARADKVVEPRVVGII